MSNPPRFLKILSRLRWLPFAYVAISGLWTTSRAPRGRKPFTFDLDLSPEAIARALTKAPHMWASAIVFLIAVLATGPRRVPLAMALSLLVGLSWELCQTTVVGHNARLADLLPDLAGILPAALAITLAWRLWDRVRRQSSATSAASPRERGTSHRRGRS